MFLKRLNRFALGWLGRPLRSEHSSEARLRGPQAHVIILDGTMSTLTPGHESHAGTLFRMCGEMGAEVSVFYEAGVQWRDWKSTPDVMMGRGINRQIRRAYGYLASRYRPGDRIFLFGYSRGAYAVRSLAGVIDQVGLLKADHATVRNIRTAYRHYQTGCSSAVGRDFRAAFCHVGIEIEMIGVWDTVKALGMRLPILRRLGSNRHAFHSPELGSSVKRGYHALALHETRKVFEPVIWSTTDTGDTQATGAPSGQATQVEQVWFRGSHGDIGGQLGGFEAARPLSNLSLIWMLEKAEDSNLPLPRDWRMRFPVDPDAPSVGTWRHWGKIFLARGRRQVFQDPSERLHSSVQLQRRQQVKRSTWLANLGRTLR